MNDPVSWLMIEPGWKVVDSGGNEIGKVDTVVGDSEEDIFNGLAVDTGMLDLSRYVPSERVQEIIEGEVRLSMSKDEVERMEPYEEPPASLEIEGEKASLFNRIFRRG